MNKSVIVGLSVALMIIVTMVAWTLYQKQFQSCNTMVTLAPGKTIQDVCDYWATQSAEFKQANRYCGCGPYK